jgi:hypothetical protein
MKTSRQQMSYNYFLLVIIMMQTAEGKVQQ